MTLQNYLNCSVKSVFFLLLLFFFIFTAQINWKHKFQIEQFFAQFLFWCFSQVRPNNLFFMLFHMCVSVCACLYICMFLDLLFLSIIYLCVWYLLFERFIIFFIFACTAQCFSCDFAVFYVSLALDCLFACLICGQVNKVMRYIHKYPMFRFHIVDLHTMNASPNIFVCCRLLLVFFYLWWYFISNFSILYSWIDFISIFLSQ